MSLLIFTQLTDNEQVSKQAKDLHSIYEPFMSLL